MEKQNELPKNECLEQHSAFLVEKAPWLSYLAKKEFWNDVAESTEDSDKYMGALSSDIKNKLAELEAKENPEPEDWLGLDYLVSDIHIVADSREMFSKYIYSGTKEKYGALHDEFFEHFKTKMPEEEAEKECEAYFHRIWRSDVRQRNYFHRAKDKESAERYREFLLQKYDLDENGDLIPLQFETEGRTVRAFRHSSLSEPLFEESEEEFKNNTYDFVFAGGVGGLINAFMLAKDGYRVAVFDEGTIGNIDKRWAIAYDELYHLVELGILTDAELQSCCAGIKSLSNRFKEPDSNECAISNKIKGKGALSVNSPLLLKMFRSKLEKINCDRELKGMLPVADLMDGTSFRCLHSAGEGKGNIIEMRTSSGEKKAIYAESCFIDAMGVSSTLMTALNPEYSADYLATGTVLQASGFARGEKQNEISDMDMAELVATISNAENMNSPQGNLKETWQPLMEWFPDADNSFVEYYLGISSVKNDTPPYFFELFSNLYAINNEGRYKRKGDDFKLIEPAIFGSVPSGTARRRRNIGPREGIAYMGDVISNVNPMSFCGFNNFIRNILPRYAALKHVKESGNAGKEVMDSLVQNNTVDIYSMFAELSVELLRKKDDPEFTNKYFPGYMKVLSSDKHVTDIRSWLYRLAVKDRFTPIDLFLMLYLLSRSEDGSDIFKAVRTAYLDKFKQKKPVEALLTAAETMTKYFGCNIEAAFEANPNDERKEVLIALNNVSNSPDEQFAKISKAVGSVDLDSPDAIKKFYYTIAKNWTPGQERTPGAKKKHWSYAGVVTNLLAREIGPGAKRAVNKILK